MAMMHSTSANLDDLDFPRNHHHQIMSQDLQHQNSIINKSTCPISWKLYQNPFFIPKNPIIANFSSNNNDNINDINSSINPLKLKPKQLQRKYSASAKFLHHSDLKMSSNSKTQIAQLKSELEMERTLRKRMQSLNKKLSKELIDQSQGNNNQMCCLNCDDLMKEVSRLKDEMEKMKEEMNEERKMLRMAEVLREERVQMKLADAQIFYQQQQQQQQQQKQQQTSSGSSVSVSDQKYLLKACNNNFQSKKTAVSTSMLTPPSPETENPHIKQGIKGFVEFQRAIKAKNNGCNFNNNYANTNYCNKQLRDLGGYSNKVECQKAQLRVLFKHKCSVPYSAHNDHSIILS